MDYFMPFQIYFDFFIIFSFIYFHIFSTYIFSRYTEITVEKNLRRKFRKSFVNDGY